MMMGAVSANGILASEDYSKTLYNSSVNNLYFVKDSNNQLLTYYFDITDYSLINCWIENDSIAPCVFDNIKLN